MSSLSSGSEQLGLWVDDPAAGRADKDTGQQRAFGAVSSWAEEASAAVRTLARSGEPFTSEDVTGLVGLPAGEVGTNRNNAVGALMTAAARAGVIRKTGHRRLCRRRSSHGRELTEWVGVRPGGLR